jgi:hypothetical protein
MNLCQFYLALSILMGVIMDITAGTKQETVYLLEIEFLWNDTILKAGRGPMYGTELPMRDRAPGRRNDGTEVYKLSPFPLKFPEFLDQNTPAININLYPPLPVGSGVLKIKLQLVSSSEALVSWSKDGVSLPEPKEGGWVNNLAGPNPLKIKFEIKKRNKFYKDSGTEIKSTSMGRHILISGQASLIEIPMTELSSSEEGYEITFPNFSFDWERRKSYLPLKWLKGKPDGWVETQESGKSFKGAEQQEMHPRKPSLWKFWKKG